MPYIKKDNRRIELQKGAVALTAGELNYQIFYHLKNWDYTKFIDVRTFVKNFLGEKPNYQKYNDMVGALNCCYKELYRRNIPGNHTFLLDIADDYDKEIAAYEDTKIIENGDVE